jgi:hypothetical protein
MALRRQPGEYVLRSTSSAVAFWVGSVVLLLVILAPAVQRDWRVFGFVVAPALLLDWALWLVLYRPAVHYDAARAVVVNIGRTYVLPWSRVRGVRQRFGMEFELDDGAMVRGVGAPPPGRTGNVASNFDRRNRIENDPQRMAGILDGVRLAAPPADAPVERRWDVIPLGIGVVLIVAVVIEFAIGI